MPRDSEQLFADLVKKGDSIMNCIDMMEIPELRETLNLRAGEEGLMHPIRWIYFADCLQCVKSEYRMESYIHGSEFVVLTNRDLTDDSLKLKELIAKMQEYDIAAVGINEGQISEELVQYCDEHRLPLFELPMRFPLVDLSQIICKRLVLEENNKNADALDAWCWVCRNEIHEIETISVPFLPEHYNVCKADLLLTDIFHYFPGTSLSNAVSA